MFHRHYLLSLTSPKSMMIWGVRTLAMVRVSTMASSRISLLRLKNSFLSSVDISSEASSLTYNLMVESNGPRSSCISRAILSRSRSSASMMARRILRSSCFLSEISRAIERMAFSPWRCRDFARLSAEPGGDGRHAGPTGEDPRPDVDCRCYRETVGALQ